MLIDAEQSQLVLVDYQARLMPAIFQGPAVLACAVQLAQAANLLGVPTFGSEQFPEKLGQNDPAVRGLCQATVTKLHFSAVPEGDLIALLRPPPKPVAGNARSLPKHLQKAPVVQGSERETIVLAGCEAHVCLLQTALELLAEDFDVCVVTDACSSRTERNRDAAFDRLAGAGAELVTTEMVLFEWLRSAEHPQFKAVHSLIK